MGIKMNIEINFVPVDPQAREEHTYLLRSLLLQGARRLSSKPVGLSTNPTEPPLPALSSQPAPLEIFHV